MSRFNEFLHRTDQRLALPEITRSQILVEIASDLEDLFQHYLAQGLTEEEAAARAEEKVDMSDDALVELVRIHSDTRTWADRLVRRARPFWERMAMAVIVLFFAVAASLDGATTPLLYVTGFVWPIAAIAVALVAVLVVQLIRSSDGAHARRQRQGLAMPLFLGAASLTLGFLGTGVVLYRTLIGMASDPERAGPIFAQGLLGGMSTLSISLLVALAAGVVWFVLAGRISRLEDNTMKSIQEVRS